MKKITLSIMKTAVVAGLVVLYSCGGAAEPTVENEETVPVENIEAVNEEAEVATDETATLDLTKGEEIYVATCQACHQANGEGLAGAFPPLAKSDYLMADINRSINEVINGKTGEVTVNGVVYNSTMAPNSSLTDQQIADVMNYILNSWGNEGGTVTLEDVAAAK